MKEMVKVLSQAWKDDKIEMIGSIATLIGICAMYYFSILIFG